MHLGDAAAGSETETCLAFLSIGQIESDLHRAAWIQDRRPFFRKVAPA